MQKTTFTSLPFATKLGIMLIPFMGWVMFAEFVIDRNGWDRFLPFYRFGQFCPYEVIVLVALGLIWWQIERRSDVQESATVKSRTVDEASSGRCC